MENRFQLKAVLVGAAFAALVSARPALAQDEGGSHCPPPCIECEVPPPPCLEVTFSPEEPTQEFNFGTGHKIKITATVLQPFTLAIQFNFIDQPGLDARLNTALAPANCIPYDGATSNTALGNCGFYHVVEPLPVQDVDYTGDVLYKVFWDFPTLDQLHNVRLYRAPIPEEDAQTCPDGFNCFTQDITGTTYAVGDSNTGDPGVDGKSKKFSDYEVVDLTSPTSPAARVWIGLKDNSGGSKKHAGTRFDLKAVVKRNGNVVSSGELLGTPGGGPGFGNAVLRTIPLSLPAEAFAPGDTISVELLVRNSCLGSTVDSDTARLWFNDKQANSRVDEPGVPTLFEVMTGTSAILNPSSGNGKKTVDAVVGAPDPSCTGAYTSFGTWTGLVP